MFTHEQTHMSGSSPRQRCIQKDEKSKEAELEPYEHFAGVAVAEREAGVRDQVRVAIGAAQQACAGIVGEPLLRALPGGLEREGWGGAGLILRETTRTDEPGRS